MPDESQRTGLDEQYIEWGEAMLTTAVFAICLTAPLGAIFINTLGTKWLDYNGDTEEIDEEKIHETQPGDSKNSRVSGIEPPDKETIGKNSNAFSSM